MKQIVYKDFRCFTDLTVNFKSGLNLLVGDNASGKTTILRGLKVALGAFFSGYNDENTHFTGLTVSDFREVRVGDSVANEKPVSICFDYSDIMDHAVGFEDTSEQKSCVNRASKKNRTETKGLNNYKAYGKYLFDTLFDIENKRQAKPLPLFASFTTEDIHSNRKLEEKRFKQYFHKPSFGYYECMQGNGFFLYWIKRLLVLTEGNKSIEEIEGVQQAIKKALGEEGCNIITHMSVRPNQGKVYYHFTDGREVEAENLSDGYTRVVNIVTDIAFRCMLLNKGIYGSKACEKTIGTVLIDEVDLHLHPTLQASILKGLQNAFPKLQFIASTHAPMVMTGVEPNDTNCVYKLFYTQDEGYQVREIQPYGLDASTIIETVLNLIPRVKEVQDKLDMLFDLIDSDKEEEARTLLLKLQSTFESSIPELNRAEAMLNFTIEPDEED